MDYDPNHHYQQPPQGAGVPPQPVSPHTGETYDPAWGTHMQPPYPPNQYSQQGPPPPRQPSFFQRRTGCMPLWVLLLVIIVVACGIIGIAGASRPSSSDVTTNTDTSTTQSTADTSVPTDTPAPTQAPKKWTTTHTYKGSGSKKTEIIAVPDDWKVFWKCDPASSYGGQYNVIVDVYNSDGTLADGAINTICKTGNTGDSTEEHQSGNIYLDITSEGDWTITIQELK